MDKDHELDSDESDEDYCPDGVENEALSECDSESDSSKSSDAESKQPATNRNHKKRKSKKSSESVLQSPLKSEAESLDYEEKEKKRADALWSQFLGETNDDDEISRKSVKPPTKGDNHSAQVDSKKLETKVASPATKTTEKVKVTEIFDFAGEKVPVTKEVDAEDAANSSSSSSKVSSATTSNRPQLKRPAVGGGLSAVLGHLNKKNKLNVLEKTKLDWDSFKDKEGLRDELKTHNKGKDGYLERQDFLERADLRQFELEREMRQNTRRSK